jgi:hypothetical protein
MSHRKHGLKALGLSFLVVLGLMAFSAAGAQAAGEYDVNGHTLTELGLSEESITGEGVAGTTSLLLVQLPGLHILIHCSLLHATGKILLGGVSHGTITFSTCHTKINGSFEPECDPIEPIIANVLNNLILHGSPTATYILFEGSGAGSLFTTLVFPEGCLFIPEEVEITGSVVTECLTVACSTSNATHKITPNNSGLFPSDRLFFGATEATFTGEAELKLSGIHSGQGWAALGP